MKREIAQRVLQDANSIGKVQAQILEPRSDTNTYGFRVQVIHQKLQRKFTVGNASQWQDIKRLWTSL